MGLLVAKVWLVIKAVFAGRENSDFTAKCLILIKDLVQRVVSNMQHLALEIQLYTSVHFHAQIQPQYAIQQVQYIDTEICRATRQAKDRRKSAVHGFVMEYAIPVCARQLSAWLSASCNFHRRAALFVIVNCWSIR